MENLFLQVRNEAEDDEDDIIWDSAPPPPVKVRKVRKKKRSSQEQDDKTEVQSIRSLVRHFMMFSKILKKFHFVIFGMGKKIWTPQEVRDSE